MNDETATDKHGWAITDGNGNIIDDNSGKYYYSENIDENGMFTTTKTAKESPSFTNGGELMGMTNGKPDWKIIKERNKGI